MTEIMNTEEWHEIVNETFSKTGGGIIYSSSGSTHKSKSLIYTTNVIDGAVRRTKEFIELLPKLDKDKVVILWGYGLFPPAYFYTIAFSEMGNLVYPLGSGKNLPIHITEKKIFEIAPSIIIGMPSYLVKVVDLMILNHHLNHILPTLKLLISGGEILTDNCRKRLESLLNVKIFDSYGMLQAPMIASECSNGNLHISKEYEAEILDKNQVVRSEGKGILLLSSKKVWFPLEMHRFKTDDVVILNQKKCDCRYETPIITILGRNNQKIKVRGQIIDFDELIKILDDNGFDEKYYIEITKKPSETIKFHILDSVDNYKFVELINDNVSVRYEIVKKKEIVHLSTETGKKKHIIIN